MEENVALDSKKQRKFAKSIKGIKSLLKKNKGKPHQPAVLAPKDTEESKKRSTRKDRGLVYLSHIPHGFYEHEMTQYFKQFGMVTNVRVIRSARTGRSKGCGFVEFKEPVVAEIVAETMNNYLMGKRLIKAVIIPPEKQKRHAMRKHWTAENNPTSERRRENRKSFNAIKDDAETLEKASKLLKTLKTKKKKLRELGIDYDFFKPVDVPETLLTQVENLESESKIEKVKTEKGKEKKSKSKTAETEDKKSKKEENPVKPQEGKSKKEQQKTEKDNLQQIEKQKKMKHANVKPPENFIQIQPESGEESDGSSVEFDSDEYEKMLENESNDSGDESEDDEEDEDEDNEEDDEDDDESEEELPPLVSIKENKKKKPIVALSPPQPKKAVKPVNAPKVHIKEKRNKKPIIALSPLQPEKGVKSVNTSKVQMKPQPQAVKRKNPQPQESPKKAKFEKKNKKPNKKQFRQKNKAK